jgi:phage-related protein
MEAADPLKPLIWVGRSRRDLQALPDMVADTFGYALYQLLVEHAQAGKKHPQAKPLRGFGSAGVLEVTEDWDGNTYRAVYTVRLAGRVFVLHVFQKKSKRGIATPQSEMNMIQERLKIAVQVAKELEL